MDDKLAAFPEWAGKKALGALVSDNHLSDEELDAVIDEGVEHPHLAACAMCRAEVEDLRSFDGSSGTRAFLGTEALRGTRERWLLAAAVGFAVIALSAIAVLLQRSSPDVPATASAQAPAPLIPVIAAPVTAPPPSPSVVASLADGAGRIELLRDGSVAGVVLRSPRDADDVRAVMSGRRIFIPTFLAALPGGVRGGDAGAHPLHVIEPFRSAVLEPRPRFWWTPVPNARSYRVAVFDAGYEEIARSEALSGTSWTPPQPLPAGVDLTWHVIADTEAGEISSAGPHSAEAVFRVLPAKQAAEVEAGEAHYRHSHLMRGLLYSRNGLLHDADREFQALAAQNPDSPVARALIDAVSR